MESKGLSLSGWHKRSEPFYVATTQLRSSQIAEMEPFAQEIPLLRLNVADSIEQMLLQMVSFTVFIRTKLGLKLGLPPSNSVGYICRSLSPLTMSVTIVQKKRGLTILRTIILIATGWEVCARHECKWLSKKPH